MPLGRSSYTQQHNFSSSDAYAAHCAMPAHLAEAQDLVDDDLNRGRVGPEQRALGLELLQVQQRLSGAASAILRQSCRWVNVSLVIHPSPHLLIITSATLKMNSTFQHI